MINFWVCIETKEYDDLEKGRVYQILPDESVQQEGYLAVVDESGRNYLYPDSYFVPTELPQKAQEALAGRS